MYISLLPVVSYRKYWDNEQQKLKEGRKSRNGMKLSLTASAFFLLADGFYNPHVYL